MNPTTPEIDSFQAYCIAFRREEWFHSTDLEARTKAILYYRVFARLREAALTASNLDEALAVVFEYYEQTFKPSLTPGHITGEDALRAEEIVLLLSEVARAYPEIVDRSEVAVLVLELADSVPAFSCN